MTTDEMNQEERRFAELLEVANGGLPPCDAQFINRLKQQTTDAFQADARPESQRSIVMKAFKRLAPIAAAACVLVTVGVLLLSDASRTSLAWGQTAQKMAQAQTMVFDTEVAGQPARMYFKGKSHIRLEVTRASATSAAAKAAQEHAVPIWDVMIWDLENGRMIGQDMVRRSSVVTSVQGKTIPGPDALMKAISNLPEKSVRQTEQGEIAGEPVTRFDTTMDEAMRKALNIDRDEWTGAVSVWVSKKTALPVQVECAVPVIMDEKGTCGTTMQKMTNIRWNEPLSDDLFKPAEGFATTEWPVADAEGVRLADRSKSAADLNELGHAFRRYAKEHGGTWPVDLDALEAPTLRQSGYTYVRPRNPANTAPDKIVMYESYDKWKDGVNVLQFDGRVQFVSDEATFKKMRAGSAATTQDDKP